MIVNSWSFPSLLGQIMHVTPETIEEFFSRYSWSYTRSSENTWITGVRTSVSSFRIFIRLSEHWVYFVINPFTVTPPNPDDRLRVYYHVLRLNLDMNMAKFGLDSDGDIFLAVELPTENFDYSHFADALNGISHHAERLYSEIFNLSHNPDVVEGRYDDELDAIEEDYFDGENNDDDGESSSSNLSKDIHQFRPLDDVGLPDDIFNDSGELGPIIAGKEVRIVDDDDGSVRIEFQTAHDLEDDADTKEEEEKSTSTSNSVDDEEVKAEGEGPTQQDSDEDDHHEQPKHETDDENSDTDED